jgi:hypothetical protein
VSNYRLTALDLTRALTRLHLGSNKTKSVSTSHFRPQPSREQIVDFCCLFQQSGPILPTPGPICLKNIEKFHLQQANVPVNDSPAVGVGSYRVVRCVGATDLQADLFVVQRTEGREKWTIQAIGLQLTWTGSGGRE